MIDLVHPVMSSTYPVSLAIVLPFFDDGLSLILEILISKTHTTTLLIGVNKS